MKFPKPTTAKKLPKCKNPSCSQEFTRQRPGQKVCSPKCAVELIAHEKEKKARKETAEKKVALRSRRDWLKLAQAAFNAYIRERDKGQPCISCGRHHTGQYHAGHYLTTGARPELRFNENNAHLQCAPCNNHKSGNIALYRPALIYKIGLAEVEKLEGPSEPQKWTIQELQAIRDHYKKKIKELQNNS